MWRSALLFRPAFWLVAAATCAALPAQALNDAMRKRFESAEKTIHSMPEVQAKKLLSQMEMYPLTPYLEMELLSKKLRDTSAVVRFMQEHAGTPIERTLRKRWLIELKLRGQAELFLKNYEFGSEAVMDCYALELRLIREKPASVWPDVRALWAVGKSQPDECDPLFERWRKAGQRTPDAVWQRVLAAVEANNRRMLPYLRSLLPKNEQYLADKWIQVIENPSLVNRKNFLAGKNAKEYDLIAYGIQKLVWKNPETALEVWQKYRKATVFGNDNRSITARQLAIALASKADNRAEPLFSIVKNEHKDRLYIQWYLTHHIRNQNWSGLIEAVKSFPEPFASEEASIYWVARAYEQLKLTDLSAEKYQALAKKRSYYGYLAAARTGGEPQLAHQPVPISETDYLAFKSSAIARRVKEFIALDRPNAAKRELTSIQRYGTELQRFASAKFATEMGWHENTISALAQASFFDDVELRFPMLYRKELEKHSAKVAIDPAWAMAIARRESTFIPTAKSSVGALGLMQIMPNTAKQIAGRRVTEQQLFTPDININYGTYYLNYLLKNHGNVVFATAAYNAGPSRIKAWRPKYGPVPMDVWIETIPFKETRDYVKNVLMYYQIYSLKMQTKHQVFAPLVSMQVGISD